MPLQFKTFQGLEGKVTIPALGAIAGISRSWTMRREESGSNAGLYSLHVVLSYANELLLSDDSVRKEVDLLIKRDKGTGKEDRVKFIGKSFRYDNNQFWLDGATPTTYQIPEE